MTWLRANVLVLILLAAVAFLWLDNRGLRQDLKNALVDRKLLDEVLKKGATADRPVTVNVTPAGTTAPVPVRVFIDRGEPTPPSTPSSTPSSLPTPRLVAEAPPIFCKTKDECDRIYRAAPQAITAEAAIRVGTIATVCLDPLPADGLCPAARRANLPLAEPIKFQASFILAEKGVFTGLNVAGSPLEITKVKTETQIVERQLPSQLPYHLGAFVRGSTEGMVAFGFRYVNRIGSGFYEIEPQMRYEMRGGFAKEVWLTYVQPIR